jgi:homopolymeric O-antigen transport system permease protein
MNPHQAPRASIEELFASFWRNRQLILQMTKREVVGRYRGSVMGLAWSFFNPLLMLAVYTFVFSVVFKARWSVVGEENKIDFAILLFVGIIVYGVFAECANRAPGLILANVNFVKKVVFPLEILPWVTMGSTLFHAGISLLVLLLAQLLLNHTMPFTAIFFPLIILPLLLATMGGAWFLSAIGVYLRDVSQSVGIFTTVLMFLSPVFYPLAALPGRYQAWVKLNPLTFILEEGRKSLIFGQLPDGLGWGIHMLVSIAIAWMGFWWFQKSRKGFADVL